MQKFYVKVSETEKPYLSDVSTDAKDGYTEVYPMDNEVLGLLKYTDKCFIREDGSVAVPGELPISQQQKQLADMQSQLTQLTTDRDNLKKQLISATNQAKSQQAIIQALTARLTQLGQNVQAIEGGVKQ